MMKRKNKKYDSLLDRQGKYGWLFILPFVLGVVFIYSDVLVDSLKFSFSNIIMNTNGYTLNFVGFDHYLNIFTVNAQFLPSLVSSVSSLFTSIPVIVIFSLFIATVLNQKMRGRAAFRAIFFIPVILATGVVASAESGNAVLSNLQNMSGVSSGISSGTSILDMSNIKTALSSLYISANAINFVINLVNNIYSVVNTSGVQIILFLAGLQSISPSVYEAASIEGATGWESFWKITLPMISPIILVNCIYTTIDMFTSSTNSIMQLISTTLNSTNGYGIASAMAWIYFIAICLFLGIIALLGKKLVFHQEG